MIESLQSARLPKKSACLPKKSKSRNTKLCSMIPLSNKNCI